MRRRTGDALEALRITRQGIKSIILYIICNNIMEFLIETYTTCERTADSLERREKTRLTQKKSKRIAFDQSLLTYTYVLPAATNKQTTQTRTQIMHVYIHKTHANNPRAGGHSLSSSDIMNTRKTTPRTRHGPALEGLQSRQISLAQAPTQVQRLSPRLAIG